MRRVYAILLAAIFSFPLISPALYARATASTSETARLPACCRKDGKHACGKKATGEGVPAHEHNRLALAAGGERCPLFPGVSAGESVPVAAILGRASIAAATPLVLSGPALAAVQPLVLQPAFVHLGAPRRGPPSTYL